MTKATDGMMRECDAVYDKVKLKIARFAQAKKKGEGAKRNKMVEKEQVKKVDTIKKLNLTIDASKVRHTHILEIKELFGKFRGESCVQMDFVVEGMTIAALHIDKPWGVKITSQLEEKIQKLPAILSIELH